MKAASRSFIAAVLALLALGACASSASSADEFDRYALQSVSASLSTTQAGAHADFTTSFVLTHIESGEPNPYAYTRNLDVSLPPGLIGNPQSIPRCTVGELGSSPGESVCPLNSQVGISEVTLGAAGGHAGTFVEPVYNMPSPGGDVVARLGFIAGLYPTFIDVRIDPTDYSLVASIENASAAAALISATTTLWGVPAAKSHDALRLTPAEAFKGETPKGGHELGPPEVPFLSNPTDCSLTREIEVSASSYQLPDAVSRMSAPFPQITGCGQLNFAPRFTALPTNPEASAPTGLDATLTIPQEEIAAGLATSTLKSAVVTLPEGLAINPAAADGLAACSPEQVGFGGSEPSHCPDAAKIGSVELDVPALKDVLKGSVYQRTPEGDHLFRFWVVTDEQGVHLKLPAEIEADEHTGQLTTLFLGIPALGGNPQVPFSELRLHVFGGPRAPLSTPSSCGTYQTHFQFSPWSGKAASEGTAPMQITAGCSKGGFAPKLSAGTESLRAGSFSPFVFTLTREDGEANPQTIAVHLPQGLLAKLGGVPLCPDAQAASGNCPAGSKVGSLTAATGVGSPLWIPQPGKAPTAAYLAGPYKGAPYSIVSVVPAQAGPFDLGLVVNRAGIRINPETALATIVTDPLPQILKGVPVTYRTVHVEVDRKDFTLNPTSCAPKTISATVTAANGATAEPSTDFQATNCAKLAYKPKLKLSFSGQTYRTGNPAIKAVLTQKPHQANTKAAVVTLPVGAFIDNAHIGTPCTRVQFDAHKCPKGSILGTAKAVTPLLSKPLTGKVYFRSNGGARELPDIVADLHGGVHITLVGYIDSVQKKGSEISRTRTRFLHVPDAPVTKFTMNLFGGKRGLIENSLDLCRGKHRAQIDLRAQNGLARSSRPAVSVRCGKKKS